MDTELLIAVILVETGEDTTGFLPFVYYLFLQSLTSSDEDFGKKMQVSKCD
jgi:hypothetical protein